MFSRGRGDVFFSFHTLQLESCNPVQMVKVITILMAIGLFLGVFAPTVSAEILPSYIPDHWHPAESYFAELRKNIGTEIINKTSTTDSKYQTTQQIRYIETYYCIVYAVYFELLPEEYSNSPKVRSFFAQAISGTIGALESALKNTSSSSPTFESVWGLAQKRVMEIGKEFDYRLHRKFGSAFSDTLEDAFFMNDFTNKALRHRIYIRATMVANKFHPEMDKFVHILAKTDGIVLPIKGGLFLPTPPSSTGFSDPIYYYGKD